MLTSTHKVKEYMQSLFGLIQLILELVGNTLSVSPMVSEQSEEIIFLQSVYFQIDNMKPNLGSSAIILTIYL